MNAIRRTAAVAAVVAAAGALLLAAPADAQGWVPGYGGGPGMMGPGMMGYDGWGWGVGMALHGVVWLVFVAALAVAAVALVRYLWRLGGPASSGAAPGAGRGSALAILEERYARGEIERDEFLKKKQDLTA